MADIDTGEMRTCARALTHRGFEGSARAALVRGADEIDRLRARLAAVEAERNELASLGKQAEQHEAWMNSRLAEVEAERDAAEFHLADARGENQNLAVRLADVLALCDEGESSGWVRESAVRARATGTSAAAAGDRAEADERVTPYVVWDLIGLVAADIPRGLSVTEVFTWDQPTLEAVADWCAAVHLRASDNDGVIVPPLPAILRSDTTWTEDDDLAAGAAGDDR